MNEGALKLSLITAGIPEGFADVVAGVLGPSIEMMESAVASVIEKNDAAALASLFDAFERVALRERAALAVGEEAIARRLAAVEDVIMRRIEVLAGTATDESDEGDTDA